MAKKKTEKIKAEAEEIPAGFELMHTLRGHANRICVLAWSADGQMLVSASDYEAIRFWDAKSGELVKKIDSPSWMVNCIAWSPNGQTLVCVDEDQMIRLVDTQTGEILGIVQENRQRFFTQKYSRLSCDGSYVKWAPTAEVFAQLTRGGRINLYTGGGTFIKALKPGRALFRQQTSFYSKAVRFYEEAWDKSRDVDYWLGGRGIPNLAWSPDGRRIASGCGEDAISVWDVENEEVFKVLEGRGCGIYSVAWSPDGQVIACAFGDSTIGVWDIGREQLLNVLEGHKGSVNGVNFSSDGTLLGSK